VIGRLKQKCNSDVLCIPNDLSSRQKSPNYIKEQERKNFLLFFADKQTYTQTDRVNDWQWGSPSRAEWRWTDRQL